MADFAYNPDWKYKVSPDYNVLVSKFENKVEQRRLKSSAKLRKWELGFSTRNTTEFNTVKSFFDTKKGAWTSFTMSLDGETVTGRFEEESFWFIPLASGIWNYGFTFQEVIV